MDPRCIFDYITTRKYPENSSKNDKRQVRLTASKYVVKENKLFWINRESKIKEVPLDKHDRQKILASYHDERGHLGIERTYHAICRQFYWKNLFQDVRKFVKSCPKCQKGGKFQKSITELHPIPIVTPWHHVCVDLIKMPTSRSDNNYILTLVDFFTKWPEAVALPSKSAENVAFAMYKIFLRMGFPSVYSSDQGREFVNSTLKHLVTMTKGSHRISTAYHPESQGLVERFNQTLQKMLVKTCSSGQDDWDEYLDEMLFAYRTVPQKSSKMSPFEVMFGRQPDNMLTPEHAQSEPISEEEVLKSLITLKNLRDKIQSEVRANVSQAQQKQILQHKKRSSGTEKTFHVGDKVLLLNARKVNRKGSKMETMWSGPYTLKNLSGTDVATLENESGLMLERKYNVSLLKHFIERPPFVDIVREKSTTSSLPNDKDVEIISEEIDSEIQHFNPVDEEWQSAACKRFHQNTEVRNPHPANRANALLSTEPKGVINMRGDGNCFFRAVSYALTGSQMQHERVRQNVVQWMKRNDDTLNNHFGSGYLDDSRMSENGIWATEVEILVTAAFLETDIQVLCQTGTNNRLSWNRYKSETLGGHATTSKCIYLANKSGVHFDYVQFM